MCQRVIMSLLLHTLPYVILSFNSVIATFARKAVFKYCPPFLSAFAKEFIATLELCADCAELCVVYEVHGVVGYGVTLFLLCIWWARDWEDAQACPCAAIEDSFLCDGSFTDPTTLSSLTGQVLAAYFTWQ